MFNFLNMLDSYEDRKVDKFTNGTLTVSTVAISDSTKPYETAISHPAFNKGKWIVVELYDTKSLAQIGHKNWIQKLSSNNLPDKLIDVSTSETAELVELLGNSSWRVHKKDSNYKE